MDSIYLQPTSILDSDHGDIQKLTNQIVKDTGPDHISQAIALYYWARDMIRYDPYTPFHLPEHYRASEILKCGTGFCIPKASLLCTLGRACGIPSRLGYAAVKNHIASPKLIEWMGNDLFDWHGFVEFYLEEKWVKATPAFNIELCEKFGVAPLEFNGREDSIFHEFNDDNSKFMTYEKFYGVYADVPVDEIVAGWKKSYGTERVESWIAEHEQ